MQDRLPIIDSHAHVIPHFCGRNRFGDVLSDRWGAVIRGGERVPMLPPTCADSTFPVESLVELMDREQVSQAVLLQNPTLGKINEYVRQCIERFPSRFAGVIQVDPRDESAPEEILQFASRRQHTLKIEMSFDWGWTGLYPDLRIDAAEMDVIWQAVSDAGLEVIIDPGPPGNPGYQVQEFDVLTSRMASTRFVIEHLGYLMADQQVDPRALAERQSLLQLGRKENVWLGLSAVPILLDDPYPCRGFQQLLREAIELVGAEKLIWGSDVPTTLNLHTYRQLLDTIRREANFLSDTQKCQILRDNARAVFQGLADW